MPTNLLPKSILEFTLSPEDNLILDEAEQQKWTRFNRALEKLSHRQREAVYLRFKK